MEDSPLPFPFLSSQAMMVFSRMFPMMLHRSMSDTGWIRKSYPFAQLDMNFMRVQISVNTETDLAMSTFRLEWYATKQTAKIRVISALYPNGEGYLKKTGGQDEGDERE